MLDVAYEKDLLDVLSNIMRNFYSSLKMCEPKLRLVLLTGVTKFLQVSVFSDFNQPEDISMNTQFDALCGITADEMEAVFGSEIDGTAGESLRQIEERGYARLYEADSRRIHLIGANFSSKTGTIDGWEVRKQRQSRHF